MSNSGTNFKGGHIMGQDPSQERLIKDAHRVLENPFWIP
jgi:hypothetical protein